MAYFWALLTQYEMATRMSVSKKKEDIDSTIEYLKSFKSFN